MSVVGKLLMTKEEQVRAVLANALGDKGLEEMQIIALCCLRWPQDRHQVVVNLSQQPGRKGKQVVGQSISDDFQQAVRGAVADALARLRKWQHIKSDTLKIGISGRYILHYLAVEERKASVVLFDNGNRFEGRAESSSPTSAILSAITLAAGMEILELVFHQGNNEDLAVCIVTAVNQMLGV